MTSALMVFFAPRTLRSRKHNGKVKRFPKVSSCDTAAALTYRFVYLIYYYIRARAFIIYEIDSDSQHKEPVFLSSAPGFIGTRKTAVYHQH